MLKQIQILETALQLHGSLAPEGVQPLHKRLLERFESMKQSIHGMDKIKRHFSESIVNTPLPPLPIEKRSMSVSHQRPLLNNNDSSDELIDDHSNYHMMNFEKEEIYTRPARMNGNYETKQLQSQRCVSNREQNVTVKSDGSPAPPVPIRPKSAYGNYDSPEIPPKSTTSKPIDSSAPPLPPRLDKRISNPLLNSSNYCSIENQENDLHSASIMKSPHQKYSVVNIPFENQVEADQFNAENNECAGQVEFRDSGISTASHDLNYAYLFNDTLRTTGNGSNQHDNGLTWQTDLNANDNENEESGDPDPPPIPRKMTNSMSYGNQSNSDIFKEENIDHSIGNGDELQTDDYCMPKII